MKEYIRCNSCNYIQENNKELEYCPECNSDNLQIFESPVDLINEADILVTESELDFLFDYAEVPEYDKDRKTCWFDIYIIKDFQDNTKIKNIFISNEVSREEELLLTIDGGTIKPKVIVGREKMKSYMSGIDENSEVIHTRFLSNKSTKRKDYQSIIDQEDYVYENKNKDNINNDILLRSLYRILTEMENNLFNDSKENIRVNKIFTEYNFLNSPFFKYQKKMPYRDSKLFILFNESDFDRNLKEIITNFNLENELSIFALIHNFSGNDKTKYTFGENGEEFISFSPTDLLNVNTNFKDEKPPKRINPNLLSIVYFKLLELKANISTLELMVLTNQEGNRIGLYTVSYNGQGYVVADFKLDSPIIFGDKEDAFKYIKKTNEDLEQFFSIKEIPESFNFNLTYSNDAQIMQELFKNVQESNLNENLKQSEEIINEAQNNNKEKRKDIQNLILNVISSLDTDQSNMKKYKAFYDEMNDEEFIRYMKRFTNSDENFYLEFLPNKSEPGLNDIEEALNKLDVPMNEFVYYRHDGNKDNPLRTRYKVPVG